jgi:hypothetical protein
MVLKTFESILEETPEPFQLPEKLEFIPEDYFKRLDEDVIFQVNINCEYDPVSLRFSGFILYLAKVELTWVLDGISQMKEERISGVWFQPLLVQIFFYCNTSQKCPWSLLDRSQVLCKYGSPSNLFAGLHTGLKVPPMEEVHCLWNPESSQSYVYSVEFEAGVCEFLNVSVKHTDRLKNKVKIIHHQ